MRSRSFAVLLTGLAEAQVPANGIVIGACQDGTESQEESGREVQQSLIEA